MSYSHVVAVSEDDIEVGRLADGLRADLDELVDALEASIVSSIEPYRAHLVDRADLRASLFENVDHILRSLVGVGGKDVTSAVRVGRLRAEQGVPLYEVLRAYRLGFAQVWTHLLAAARREGPRSVDAVVSAATRIWSLSDEFPTAVAEAYQSALNERMIVADRRRSGLLSALVDGGGPYSTWEVAKLLEIPYEGRFLVVVVEIADPDGAGTTHLADQLRRADVVSAWRSQADYEIGLLSLPGRRPADEVLLQLGPHAQARIGVSPVFDRLDGTARAVRHAQVAMESLPAGRRGVRQLQDEPVLDLLVRDRDTTRRFVDRVLGGVLGLPGEDCATLLATATAWLDARGSASEAGKVLYCHENTVRARIRRLEDHLGVSFDDPRHVSDLLTALQAIRVFPELAEVEPH